MKAAIDKLDDTELGGKRIRIEEDKPRSRRRRYVVVLYIQVVFYSHLFVSFYLTFPFLVKVGPVAEVIQGQGPGVGQDVVAEVAVRVEAEVVVRIVAEVVVRTAAGVMARNATRVAVRNVVQVMVKIEVKVRVAANRLDGAGALRRTKKVASLHNQITMGVPVNQGKPGMKVLRMRL